MPIKPEDFLNESQSYIRQDSDEIQFRCSISRSYYAMYHKVLSILDNAPRSYPRMGDHSSLIQYLTTDAKLDESIPFNSLKSLAYMLRQERTKRNEADYDLDDVIGRNDALESLGTAKRCLERCDQLKTSNRQLTSNL